ncbi:MAG TPA: ABC transporter substrate-binding protein [Acidimicrobiia bacterium]|nr:ABC transporter substrate-binding protein [Acidimicrobiia bacterium]
MAAAAVAALGVAGLASAGTAATSGGDSTGVTDKEIKLGFIASTTGVAGSTFKNSTKGFDACVGAQNAKGGVNGRKITYEFYDDGAITNLQGVQDLVQNRGVFAVVNDSSFAFQGYQFLLDNGVPMVGGGFDGPEYGLPGNEDLISLTGNAAPIYGVSYTGLTNLLHDKLKAKKMGVLAYKVSASSTAAAENLQKYAVPEAGMKAAYTNTSLDFGTTDVGPQVLAMKEAGVDAVYLPLVASSNFAVLQTAAQNNLKFKAAILATGYGQDLLDQPVAATLGPEVLLASGWKPVELKDAATKQFQNDLAKYGDWPKDQVPDFGIYTGYLTCKLTMAGLEAAGKDLTRQGFIDATKALGEWDGAGLTCQPVRLGLDTYGTAAPTQCGYYLQVKDGKFVPYNNGKPISGKLIQATTKATTTTAPAGS